MNDERAGSDSNARNRSEVAQRIEWQVLMQGRRNRKRRADEIKRITIGRGFGDDIGCDHAAPAWAVIDDHVLPDGICKLMRDDARSRVVAAAGRQRNYHTNGSCRIRLNGSSRHCVKPGGLRALPASGPAANESGRAPLCQRDNNTNRPDRIILRRCAREKSYGS